ncbi:hypothetical protein ABG768_020562, partial [Culter alburnus]
MGMVCETKSSTLIDTTIKVGKHDEYIWSSYRHGRRFSHFTPEGTGGCRPVFR